MSRIHFSIGFATAIIAFTLLFPRMPVSQAFEREELGRILKAMPPPASPSRYGNVTLRQRAKAAGMAAAVFPHWSHRSRYACRVCHGELDFAMRSGGSGITRQEYLSGKYCGACHDGRTAFSAAEREQCERCHLKELRGLDARFASFAAQLPSAPHGNRIDWVAARTQGLIRPLRSLTPGNPAIDLPVALQQPLSLGTTAPRSSVAFSHRQHLEELTCENCHPEIFTIKKRGTVKFSMEVNLYGQFCGVCHMQVAFPLDDCRRCHAGMSNIKVGL